MGKLFESALASAFACPARPSPQAEEETESFLHPLGEDFAGQVGSRHFLVNLPQDGIGDTFTGRAWVTVGDCRRTALKKANGFDIYFQRGPAECEPKS